MVVPDVATKILGMLDRTSLITCRAVCKEWKDFVDGKTAICWTTISKNGVIPLHHALIQEEFELCEKILKQVWSLIRVLILFTL